uniref:P2X purinoreceptor 7 intracellular domain-containing protein n=1 Tax=Hippocampus comes TaxID=109280 RepID=A0A3Q2YNL4_HIPCM
MQSISNNDSNSDTSNRSSASENIQVFEELEEEEEPDANQDANNVPRRCTCGECQQMPTALECVCCHEIQEVVTVRQQGEEHFNQVLDCITDHPGLNAVCLDPYGLHVAWMTYKQQYKGKAFDGPQDPKYSHIAYRQLVRWWWKFLGQDNRVVLPACAVSCIRAHFPPPGEEESAVFKGFCVPRPAVT